MQRCPEDERAEQQHNEERRWSASAAEIARGFKDTRSAALDEEDDRCAQSVGQQEDALGDGRHINCHFLAATTEENTRDARAPTTGRRNRL